MKSKEKIKLTFASGAGTVTGANFLLETPENNFLVDCGMIQGVEAISDANWKPFPYDTKRVKALFVTHAHIDHVGRIPKLIAEGFEGEIYSTPPTKDIARLMLEDASFVMEKNKDPHASVLSHANIEKALSLWKAAPYGERISFSGNVSAVFRNSGHILGSAMVEITACGKKIVFTGDIGNSPSPIMPDADIVTDANYLVIESVYGDRVHEGRDERREKLERIIEYSYHKGGTLVIPTFSLERSQELLFELNALVEGNHIPQMPIFFDSPLAIRLNKVYKSYTDYLNENAKRLISGGDDIFAFPGLRETLQAEESKSIFSAKPPKIIIAGSGMSTGGRIMHHEKNYLPDPKTTLLLIGYQAVGTLGRKIQDGAKEVLIYGEKVPIKAKVETIMGYSGHCDGDALLGFIKENYDSLNEVFCVMGEPRASLFLSQRVRDYLGIRASVPGAGESVDILCEK